MRRRMGTAKIDKLSHKKVPKVPGVTRVRVDIRSEQAREFGGGNALFAAY